jgi:hypothetical protein
MWVMLGRGRVATGLLAAGLAGIGFAFVQFAIDIVVGFMAADHEAMGPLFDQVQAVPGVPLLVYEAGPILFYLAQLALVIHLAVQRQVKPWVPALVLVQILLPFASLDLIPVGAVVAMIAFLPLATRPTKSALAHA